MSTKRLAVAAFAVGLLLIGYGLGQYVQTSTNPQLRPQPRPRPRTPAYVAPPRTESEATRRPANAAPPRAAETRDAILDVLREPEAFARASRLSALLATLGPETVPEVRAALENPAIDSGNTEIALMVRFWATHDPKDAALWAWLEPPTGYRSGAIDAAFELWATADPEAALQRVQGMAMVPGEGLLSAEMAVVRGWFESRRPGLEDYIRDLGPGIQQQRTLSVFARRAIQRDGPEAIARWAESIPDEDRAFKLAAFRMLGSELAKIDPDAARAWCEAHCDGPFGSNVRMLIAQRWAALEPRTVMQWLATAPAGQERDWAVKGAYRGWLRKDREDLTSWVTAMGFDGVEPWFQPALEGHAIRVGKEDPGEGLRWAAIIANDVIRERAFVTIARRWRAKDESAADAWIEQSPLSEEARRRARTPLPPPTPSP